MTVQCEAWWAALWLLEHGHAPPAKICRHPQDRCPKPIELKEPKP